MVKSKMLIQNRAMMGGTPGEILEDVNEKLREGNTAYMFVTVWLGILTISTGHIIEANAGHTNPAVLLKGEGFELIRKKHGSFLGIRPGKKYADDEHNRIATTDVRLLRRMVRDNRTRGTSASGTLNMWHSVRRGEEKYIFPFQESADAVFNSALIYELSVLKLYAEPLLFGISKEDPQYYEAKRLLKFLDYFLGMTSEGLPNNSLIREFVGGSIFNV